MSRETVQFVELVRQAAARPATNQTYPLHCERCGKQTRHTLESRGDWEVYVCSCGERKEYRVR